MTGKGLMEAGAASALEAESLAYAVESAISQCARTMQTFHVDDVWDILYSKGVTILEHPNALGGAFIQAAHYGVIKASRKYIKTKRLNGRHRAVQVWVSLIFKGTK